MFLPVLIYHVLVIFILSFRILLISFYIQYIFKMKSLVIIIIYNLFFNLLLVESLPDWKNLAQKLKEKLKTVYKKKMPKSRESVSVGSSSFSALDYPKNVDALKKINELWQDYYKCLESKYKEIPEEKTVFSYALAAFTKSFIQLDCNVCVSPEDILEDTHWHFVDSPFSSKAALIEEDEHKQISAFTFTLHFSDLQPFHQGMYFCHLKSDVDVPYFLHVLNSSVEPIAEVRPNNAKKGPFSQNPVKIKNTEISMWNDWTPWTECSICGKIGKKTRIGYCYVGLTQNLPSSVRDNLVSSKENLDISDEALRETTSLMKNFVHGIPCRSALLPPDFKDQSIIKTFPTEIMTSFCKVSCPSNVMFEVVDKYGNVVDQVNNSAGVYSVYQELPPQLQTFQHTIQDVKLGHSFILSCPNLLYKDAPVQWSVGGKILIKENIEKVSHKRITLSNLNEIIFARVEEIDTNKIYSCYQLKERVGAVELKIQPDPPILQSYIDGINLYSKIMFFCIVFTFIYIPFRMCLTREKAAAGQYIPPKKELTIKEFLIKMYHDSYIHDMNIKI